MSLNFDGKYAPRSNPADANYPYGSFKNSSTPLTGTPVDKEWANDILGFLQKLLNDAGITPSGVPDTIVASDYFDGLNAAIDARTGLASGTKMVFYQAAAPTGWTQDTSQNDKALRIVSGVGGGSGGSLVLSAATVTNHTLLTSEIPAHTHSFDTNNGTSHSNGWVASTSPGGVASFSTDSTGGGGAHNHGLALAYIDVIICTKD